MHLATYVGLQHAASKTLAESFREVAASHRDEPDVAIACATLASACDRHVLRPGRRPVRRAARARAGAAARPGPGLGPRGRSRPAARPAGPLCPRVLRRHHLDRADAGGAGPPGPAAARGRRRVRRRHPAAAAVPADQDQAGRSAGAGRWQVIGQRPGRPLSRSDLEPRQPGVLLEQPIGPGEGHHPAHHGGNGLEPLPAAP